MSRPHTGPVEQAGRFGTAGTQFAYFDSRPATGVYTEILLFDQPTLANMATLKAGTIPTL